MNYDPLTSEDWKRIKENRSRPPQERFQALVDRGIIDSDGRVLVRMPVFDSDRDPTDDPAPHFDEVAGSASASPSDRSPCDPPSSAVS